ncbi:MAG: hypothetical protein WBQ17_14315 [Rhizomicrobium sp.]
MAKALDREIRKLLGTAVRKARIVAEDGARKALTELGVEDARKPDGFSPEQIELRNRLRAHARSLGDAMQANDALRAERLVREIAYEHWHRALFARFLAENNLLLDPEHKVPVSLAELDQISREEGRDAMALAADWAEPMLPQIFRKDDPVLVLSLPPETKAGIAELVNGLPRAVFEADDSLGWVYQFWQADSKDRINDSEVKIGADELPAVTQLFTEDYMVLFLLENTLGAWWAGKQLAENPKLATEAQSEDELREKTSPQGYRWTYLRFVREPLEGEATDAASGPWRPAAGIFEGWPKAAKDITVLDPCMGSGHFLVFALPILVAFRRAEEGLDERSSIKAVLADNLFGLEIDPRCTQIAAFTLALASWKRLGGPEVLPKLNLACSGLAIGLGKAEFLRLAEKLADADGWTGSTDLLGTDRSPLGATVATTHRGELEALYDLFEQAPYLGSLIDPRRTLERKFGPLYATGMEKLGAVLEKLLESETPSPEARETAVVAEGLAKAAAQLSRQYNLVATNVPYLGKGAQSEQLLEYLEANHNKSRNDLAFAMIERVSALVAIRGSGCFVCPQSWLYLSGLKAFRKEYLGAQRLEYLARLGARAFDTISGEVVNVCLFCATNQKVAAADKFAALDVSDKGNASTKAQSLLGQLAFASQYRQLRTNDAIVTFDDRLLGKSLSQLAKAFQGIATGDYDRFGGVFWEQPSLGGIWDPQQSTVDSTECFVGRQHIVRWERGRGELHLSKAARIQGLEALNRQGICVSQMGAVPATLYTGELFDNNCSAVTVINVENLPAVWAFVASGEYSKEVRKIDKSIKVTNATLTKVPFDLAYWQKIAAEQFPNGLPRPYSNDPTQWLFDGYPCGSADPNILPSDASNRRLMTSHGVRCGMAEHPLQVVVARFLGYRWPRQTGSAFMDCPEVSEQDEIDRSGLVDVDGIVALSALAGEPGATSRLRELIRTVWGPDYDESTVRELLAAENSKSNDLATWLADEFFEGHCRLFHQTPFIWHIWDGSPGGFSALVNYHKLCAPDGAGRRLLEKLRDTHLGEWIAAQKRAQLAGEPGAEDRLIAAEHLRGELTKIIVGEPRYDIFVRWKPLSNQPIGWEPDIEDGVRLNIRPFLTARPKIARGKDACILRTTPRVKKYAGADRGAEPQREKNDYPWFWADDNDAATEDFAGGTDFKGRRYNDFHYSRSFKEAARAAQAVKK